MSQTLYVELVANVTGYRTGMLGAAKDTDKVGDAANRTGKSVSVLEQVARKGPLVLAAGMALAARESLSLDKAMRNVNSIVGMTEQQLAATTREVMELSTKLPQSSTVLAEGLYDIASSGFQGADGLTVLKASATAASAGLTETAVSAKAISAVLNAYDLSASSAADVSDILFSTVNLGVTSFASLAHNVGDYLGQAKALDVQFAETGSAIATMTLQGTAATEVGTILGSIFNQLIKPSENLAGVLQEIGYSSGSAAIEGLGLRGTLMAISEATGGTAEGMGQVFTDTTALRGVLNLTSLDGAKWAEVAGKMETQQARAGASAKALAEQSKGLGYQFQLTKNQAMALAVPVATKGLELLAAGITLAKDAAGGLEPTLSLLLPLLRSGGQILDNLGSIAGSAAESLWPIAQAGGAIVGVPLLAFLTGVAGALEAGTGFLERHETLVQGLAVAYVASLIPALVLAGSSMAATLYLRALYAIDALALGVTRLSGAFAGLTVAQGLSKTLGATVAMLGGPFGLAMIAGAAGLFAFSKAKGEAKARVQEFTAAIEADSGALGTNTRATVVAALEKDGLLKAGLALGVSSRQLTDAVLGEGDAMAQVNSTLDQMISGTLDADGAMSGWGMQAQDLKGDLSGLSGEVRSSAEAAKRQSDAIGGTAGAQDAAGAATAGATGKIAEQKVKVEELTATQRALATALGGFSDPLGTYNAMLQTSAQAVADSTSTSADSWESYADDVDVSLSRVATKLEADNLARQNWQANLIKVAQTAGTDVAQILGTMGEEGVRLTAAMATGTTAEVARMSTALRVNAQAGGEDAARAFDTKMQLMGRLAKSGGTMTAEQLAQGLSVGVADVTKIAEQYGYTLAASLNPLLQSLGRPGIGVSFAPGQYGGKRLPLAEGGRVWGAGTATSDSIPAQLSRGEFVVRTAMVDKYGPGLLEAINAGSFAAGGMVPKPPSLYPYGPPVSSPAQAAMSTAHGDSEELVAAAAAGAVAGVAQTPGQTGAELGGAPGFVKMMQALRGVFPALQLISGLRPGAITATGNPSMHGKGRAVDIPPRMDVFNWIAQNYGAKSKEVIFSPAGGRQIYNGGPHVYREPTKSMHYNHVHWSMAKGGLLNPHVRDRGGPLLPGYTLNATGGPETVVRGYAGGGLVRDPTGGRGVAVATAGMTDPLKIKAVTQAYQDYSAAVESAARRAELLSTIEASRKDLGVVKDLSSRTAVTKELAAANKALADFDRRAAAEAASSTVARRLDALDQAKDARQKQQEAAKRIREAATEQQLLQDRAKVLAQMARVSPVRGTTLAAAAGRLDDPEKIRALITAWGDHNDKVGEAIRRTELLAAVKTAKADVATSTDVIARTSAMRELAQATAAVRDFDLAVNRDRQQAAAQRRVELLTERAENERRLREARSLATADKARASITRGMAASDPTKGLGLAAASGKLSDPEKIRALASAWGKHNDAVAEAVRLSGLQQAVSEAKTDLARAKGVKARAEATVALRNATVALAEYEQGTSRQAAAAAAEARADDLSARAAAAKVRSDEAAEQLKGLNDLLDAEEAIRKRQVTAQVEHADRRQALYAEQVKTEREFAEASMKASRELAAEQSKLLTERARSLENWARADERTQTSWGSSVGQLTANVKQQLSAFSEWSTQLAAARGRGVSEQVIASLGLDQGPQALGQLRQFTSATAGEIANLNDVLAVKAGLAQTQSRVEAAAGYGQLGRDLADTQARYAEQTLALQAKHREDMAQLAHQLMLADAALRDQQAALATELAALGERQGRGYGEALVAGLNSQVANVRAAAQALQAAAAARDVLAAADEQAKYGAPAQWQSPAPAAEQHTYVVLDGKVIQHSINDTLKGRQTAARIAQLRLT